MLDQPVFLNTVVEALTTLAGRPLLDAVKRVERTLGRQSRERWGPREIDIDVLLHGATRLEEPGLEIPHRADVGAAVRAGPAGRARPDLRGPDGRPIGEHVPALRLAQEAARSAGNVTATPAACSPAAPVRLRWRTGPAAPPRPAGPPASRRPRTRHPARTPAPPADRRAEYGSSTAGGRIAASSNAPLGSASSSQITSTSGRPAIESARPSARPTDRIDCATISARASSIQPSTIAWTANWSSAPMSGPITLRLTALTSADGDGHHRQHDAAQHAQAEERPEPAPAGGPERSLTPRRRSELLQDAAGQEAVDHQLQQHRQRHQRAGCRSPSSGTPGEAVAVVRLHQDLGHQIQPARDRAESARQGRSPASAPEPEHDDAGRDQRRAPESRGRAARPVAASCPAARRASSEHACQQRGLDQRRAAAPPPSAAAPATAQRRGRRPARFGSTASLPSGIDLNPRELAPRSAGDLQTLGGAVPGATLDPAVGVGQRDARPGTPRRRAARSSR